MFYQQLLTGSAPYVARVMELSSVPVHFHHEIELLYCRSGSFEAIINGISYKVNEGNILFAGSMSAHEMVCDRGANVLLIEIGPVFLKEHFKRLCGYEKPGKLFCLNDSNFSELKKLFEQTLIEYERKDEFSELKITGNIYNICACILENLRCEERTDYEKRMFKNIGNALELVYYHYKDNITVDDAARLTGYSKSNFCKFFKNAVGMSFHAYLNKYRIENAKYLLNRTGESVESIAAMTGFADSKNFCRAFKRKTGQTPLEYRKSN